MATQPRHQRSGSAAASAADRHRPRHATHSETRPMPPVRPDIPSGDFYGDEDIVGQRSGLGHVEGIIFTCVCVLLALIAVTLVGVNVHRGLGMVGDLVLVTVLVAVAGTLFQSSAVHR